VQAQNKQLNTDAANIRPIEYLTENGFSIVRRWEFDQVGPPAAGPFHFLVRNPQDLETEIIVEVAGECSKSMTLQTREQLLKSSSFWIVCAENHLAEYVWEHGAFPKENKLVVDCLNPAEVVAATRWSQEPAR
jgi:hypothetical protein